MKRASYLIGLVFIVGLLFSQQAKASHAAGGEIWYDYIGDSTGVPNQYLVSIKLYRDASGITLPTSLGVCVSSSCFSNTTLTLPMIGAANQPVPGLDPCADDQSDPNYVPMVFNYYKATVVLGGLCADWRFSYSLNARNAAITNLVNPGSTNITLEAKLNNLLGHNDSPRFITPAAKNFCVGVPGQQPFVFPQFSLENDGDSVMYEWGHPQTGSGCPPNFTDIPFVSPFTKNNPMSTYNGITLDPRNGTFTFLPDQPGVVVMKTVIKELRFDSVLTQWVFIGSSTRDVQVPILSTCNQSSQAGPQINMSASTGNQIMGVRRDSINALSKFLNIPISNGDSVKNGGFWEIQVPVIDYSCYSTRVTVEFDPDTEVMCNSIADDGSDFRIKGPDGSLRPVVGVDKKCPVNKIWTSEIDLLLHKPLDVNGLYYLYTKTGNDGNTLENFCGFEIDRYFLIILEVTDCPELDYGFENVTVVNDAAVNINWYADTSTYKLFNEWLILRSHAQDPSFYPIAKIQDPNARSYLDTAVTMAELDAFNYRYAVQMIQNFSARPPTRIITDVLFSDTLTNNQSRYEFYWTRYDGYETVLYPSDSTEYEVFYSKVDTTRVPPIVWKNFDGPFTDIFESSWQLPTVEEKKANADTLGVYVFKVVASPASSLPNNPYQSESNWVYLELIGEDEPEPPVIPEAVIFPNIFTPNNDMVNDVFMVQNAEPYTQPDDEFSVSVYNRWGKLVYEEGQYGPYNNETDGWNGEDMNSGQKLADGVYYYIVKMRDAATGYSEDHKGQLHLLSVGTK